MGKRESIAIAGRADSGRRSSAGCGGGSDSQHRHHGHGLRKRPSSRRSTRSAKKGTERMQRANPTPSSNSTKTIPASRTRPSPKKLVGTVDRAQRQDRTQRSRRRWARRKATKNEVDAIISALEEGLETAEDNPEAAVASSDAVVRDLRPAGRRIRRRSLRQPLGVHRTPHWLPGQRPHMLAGRWT